MIKKEADILLNQQSPIKTEQMAKCWEVLDCKEKACPAYMSGNLRCWLVPGTHCRNSIQGNFLDKIELCIGCNVFSINVNADSIKETLRIVDKQFREFRVIVQERDEEVESIGLELAISLSEVFEALKKISLGDPSVKISEGSKIELISRLKHIVNLTAGGISEIIDLSHEFAICLAEHFDVLHRVSKGDLNAKVTGASEVDLLEQLKNVTNETIENISHEINKRKNAEDALRKSEERYRIIFENTGTPTIIVEEDMVISMANKEFEKFSGYLEMKLKAKKPCWNLF